jgi:hypothetical protein
MVRQAIVKKPMIIALLFVQLIPLVLFPLSIYTPSNQDWWLPLMLLVMILVADYQIIFQKRDVMWPWYLLSFAQGFNIISRIMMMFPHATINVAGQEVFNGGYIALTFISMLLSTFLLWFIELPEVRMVMLRE